MQRWQHPPSMMHGHQSGPPALAYACHWQMLCYAAHAPLFFLLLISGEEER